jgi:hypothetical protein
MTFIIQNRHDVIRSKTDAAIQYQLEGEQSCEAKQALLS